MRNPFYHRRAITEAENFYGRGLLVRNLLEMVASGQSCALVGERRIGKSSLLHYLADPRVREAHGVGERLVAGYLDFLAFHTASPEELWSEIVEALLGSAGQEEVIAELEPLSEKSPLAFVDLRRALRRLGRAGWRVVLFCDEFEFAVENPNFDVGLFGALRSLAGTGGMVFVTASRLGLFELEQYRGEEARRKILGSPFFNIFAEFVVGPFEDHEVAELIASSLEKTAVRFDADDVAFLGRVAGRHPYFLQLASYHLYAALERGGLSGTTAPGGPPGEALRRRAECRAEAREELRREAAKIFRNQWQQSDETEEAALIALAKGEKVDDSVVLARLARRGLLTRRGKLRSLDDSAVSSVAAGGYRLFSDLLGEWIRSQAEGPVRGRRGSERSAEIPERYEVLEELGRSSAGSVYKVWDRRLHRVVALKTLSRAFRGSPEQLEQLLAEARTCAGLSHPHIVMVHDVDVERGFVIEEFVAGGSLRDLLDRQPVLPPRQVAALAVQLAEALGAAHRARIFHRDLKPDSVLLTHQPMAGDELPAVKLADFGTAPQPSPASGPVPGLMRYEASPAADFHGLGAVLFEARNGHHPSLPGTDAELGASASTDDLEFALRLDAIIDRCLDPVPERRPQSAEEILAALGV